MYSNVLNGCAMEIPRQKMASLMGEPGVKAVEEDVIVTASQVVTNPVWGLDRIDQCGLPLDGSEYQKMDASGVKIYILDTGIQGTHNEFSGMIDPSSTCHGDFVNEGDALNDGHGHGYVICTTYDMYILCHVNHNLTVLIFLHTVHPHVNLNQNPR